MHTDSNRSQDRQRQRMSHTELRADRPVDRPASALLDGRGTAHTDAQFATLADTNREDAR